MSINLADLPENMASTATELAKKIDFERIDQKGANGYVLIGRNRQLDRKVVVKFYYWGGGAHAEPKLLSELASPNVLQVHDAAAIDEHDAYFVTPFCDHGDLDDVISTRKIGVYDAVNMLLGVASGTAFIHAKGFVHRDLKPSNVFMMENGSLVIGDFGSVCKKNASGYAETSSRHSLLYRTPEEVENGRAYDQSDIYQLGILFYQLLGGHLPYDLIGWLNPKEKEKYCDLPHPDNQIYAKEAFQNRIIKNGNLLDLRSLPAWCPAELQKIIRKCCRVKYNTRFDSAATLIGHINNIRSTLPDWRFEPEPVLYRKHARFRVMCSSENYSIEKMARAGTTWRKVHSLKPATLREAIQAAEAL